MIAPAAFSRLMEGLLKATKVGLVLVLVGLALTGLRSVGADETALVLRFGKLHHQSGPGLIWTFPQPVDRVIFVPTGRVQELTVKDFMTQGPLTTDLRSSRYSLTGDQGALLCEASAKFRVVDPQAWALNFDDGTALLQSLVASSITGVMAQSAIDDLLTAQKDSLAAKVMAQAQKRADALGLGAQLVSLEFRSLEPPQEVKSAFDDVNTARVNAETAVQLARHYAEEVVPEAAADADRAVADARVVAELATSQARTNVAAMALEGDGRALAHTRWNALIHRIASGGGHLYLVEAGKTPWLKLP